MAKKREKTVQCPMCEFMSWSDQSKAVKHLKNARKEMLLAVKSVVESCLSALDVEEKPAPKAKKVKIS